MAADMATMFYRLHYEEKISPRLSAVQKEDIAHRISELTLRSPIWLDRDTDYSGQFPELAPHVNVTLSGLYLVAILEGIMQDLTGRKF